MTVPLTTLGKQTVIVMGQSPSGESYNRDGKGVPLLNGPTEFGPEHPIEQQWTTAPTKLCAEGDILFCVRGATAGRLNIADKEYCLGRGVAAIRPIQGISDNRFLFHVLKNGYARFQARGVGSTFININRDDISAFPFPLVPLPEQRRIAAILDQAEALRAKRRQALARTNTLSESIFKDFFGDPVSNPKNWDTTPFVEFLESPLRNGVSPSNSGKVMAEVLTLSAITGDGFQVDASKKAPFASIPPADQRVCSADLLICRGNGNLRLVGKGYFPPSDFPDLVFPDTMIAARVSTDRVNPAFLQTLWNGPFIRRQIESRARTTNGTYKVNQGVLETIQIILPPLALQEKFALRTDAIRRIRVSQQFSLEKLDELFTSLQHRAFRGEL